MIMKVRINGVLRELEKLPKVKMNAKLVDKRLREYWEFAKKRSS